MHITSMQALVVGIGFLTINLVILKVAITIKEPVAGDAWLIQDEYEGRMFWLALGWLVSLVGAAISLFRATSWSVFWLMVSMALVTPFVIACAKNAIPRPMSWSNDDVRSINLGTLSLQTLFIGMVGGLTSNDTGATFGPPLIYVMWFLALYAILRKKYTPAPS
jgi:hypothetical protein